jgi:hypothetical protein
MTFLNDFEQTFVFNPKMKIQILTVGRQKLDVICGASKVTIRQVRKRACKNFKLDWKVGSCAQRQSISCGDGAMEEARNIFKYLVKAEGEKNLVRSEDVFNYRECQKRLGAVPPHEAVAFFLIIHNVDAPKKMLGTIID